MNDSRAIFIALFVVAVVVLIASGYNCFANIAPQHGYVEQAASYLDQVKAATTFEEKMRLINESLQTYQQGSNLKDLQTLASMTSAEQIDMTIQRIATALHNEYSYYFVNFRNAITAALEVGFVILATYGSISDYTSWDEINQYLVVGAIIFILGYLLAIV